MYEFVSENLTTILIVAAAVAIVLIILCIVAKLFKIAIGLAILYVVVPIIFTIFWGDGGRYVAKFASFFSQNTSSGLRMYTTTTNKKTRKTPS